MARENESVPMSRSAVEEIRSGINEILDRLGDPPPQGGPEQANLIAVWLESDPDYFSRINWSLVQDILRRA